MAKLPEWIQQVIVHVFMQISSHFGLRAFCTQVYFLLKFIFFVQLLFLIPYLSVVNSAIYFPASACYK